MSNTSMSMHTQSMVQGTDTERGANILKDSGVTLQEDSTVVHDDNENDDEDSRISMTKQNQEILTRQLGSGAKHEFSGEADTPLLRQDLTGEVRVQ